MKKQILRAIALFMTSVSIFATGCQMSLGGGKTSGDSSSSSHDHRFSIKKAEEQYLKSEATCLEAATYYFSCECGEKSEETFTDGKALNHDYSAQITTSEYFKTAADCQTGAEYYYSCSRCGVKGYRSFFTEELGDHVYTEKKATKEYLKSEATFDSAAEYYKSCVCGMPGEETFFHGDPLRMYTEEEKIPYTPTSLTVTLYDTATSTYGFTYNTAAEPLRPIIQIAEGDSLNDCKEYAASVEKATSYGADENQITYYVVKVEVPLEANKTYTYRAYDKYVDKGSELVTFEAKDISSDKFSFVHVSDSQQYPVEFGNVLANVVDDNDFILHTGDVVESSKHEHEWTAMLHGNFEYLSKIPMMALSGNHETTYKNGSNETYKHFHNQMPKQAGTERGYYYSFVYGNAKFIMLNTNNLMSNKLETAQYNWLVDELENNDCTWTFVALHNPIYSAGAYGADPSKNAISLALRKQLQGIFVEYGVDVVFQGHDHLVSKTFALDATGTKVTETTETIDGISYTVDPAGVIYIMSGPAGGQTRSPHKIDKKLYDYALASNASSWSQLTIDGNTLTVSTNYVQTGTVTNYRSWGIKKTA
ncbi:MAG: metallophosphoesterase family protein [Clostridia bacterium]|nr:metallophosphoesterase family protein [Clostridia bacterium]